MRKSEEKREKRNVKKSQHSSNTCPIRNQIDTSQIDEIKQFFRILLRLNQVQHLSSQKSYSFFGMIHISPLDQIHFYTDLFHHI